MIRILRAVRARDDDRGVAIAAVVAIGMVVMLLVATMVAVATSGARVTATDTAWNRAIAAAYAGVADYQSRINADNTYGLYGQPSAPFSQASGSGFPKGTGGNAAFNYQSGTDWVTVPSSDGSGSNSSFRYAVDSSKLTTQGVIRVQSTGRSANTTRTVVANIRPDGFSNYLYFTNYESGDPTVTNEKGVGTSACTSAYRPLATTATCDQIQFGQNDVLEGPVRSNDQIKACGSTFKSTVQSVYGWTSSGCGTAAAKFASNPTTVSTLTPPATIGDLRDSMRTDLPATVNTVEGTGCLYTGPTKITFNGNGTMTVVSPLTIKTVIRGVSATSGALITAGDVSDKCGAVSALRSAAGAVVPIPKNNMVYVQNEPAARAAGTTPDPNYWKGDPQTKNLPTACDTVGTASSVTSSKANGVGFPLVGGSTSTSEADPTAGGGATISTPYGCDRGDAFVQGTVDKAVTIAAENYLYVTGDVKYPSTRSASTVLGLIGQRAVWVWNPVNSLGNPLLPADREVDAAILSNLGTFVVQNWTRGPTTGRGTLTVSGSIAQNFRGAVGLASGQGFDKSYRFDASLATYTPPKFPQPTVTTYRVATQVESKTAYDADGTPRS